MKPVIYILCFVVLLACYQTNKEQAKIKNEDKEEVVYDMYQPSEMSLLMNTMYDYNLSLKKDILAGKIPTQFPLDFLKIHKAELSNFKHRNATFKSFSELFLEAEKEIFNTNSTIPIEERFNTAVGLCISCHQTECTGPIPRIKKLLIK
ncbi:hypothetical protein [Lacinutrix salivirga]